MSNTSASGSPRQSIINRTRQKIAGLLRREADLRAGPRPAVKNSDGHLYRVALCMGKSQDFYAIGKWYKIVSLLNIYKKRNSARLKFVTLQPI